MKRLDDILAHAWNVFSNRSPTKNQNGYIEQTSSNRLDKTYYYRNANSTIAIPVFNRIAMDVAGISIRHVKEDEEGKFVSYVKDGLDRCLNVEANIDQSGSAFIQDIVMSMFDEGCVAVAPIDTDISPGYTSGYDILSMRVCKIISWMPKHVELEAYNDQTGNFERVIFPKNNVAIIENPFYSIINSANGTLKRLMQKTALLDKMDSKTASGKLDMIIQLPYVIKTERRRIEADKRRQELEEQLSGSKYGIGYIDGTEKITQLNRPLDNQLLAQIDKLETMFYNQMSITPEIMNGTANEDIMNNYYTRTIEPILKAIADEFKRKFFSKTAITQGHNLAFNRNPFKLMPIKDMAEIADKFTRNEILTSNEFRGILGFKPSSDPKADQLVNSNIAQDRINPMIEGYTPDEGQENQNGMNQEISDLFDEFVNQIVSDIDNTTEQIKGGEEE